MYLRTSVGLHHVKWTSVNKQSWIGHIQCSPGNRLMWGGLAIIRHTQRKWSAELQWSLVVRRNNLASSEPISSFLYCWWLADERRKQHPVPEKHQGKYTVNENTPTNMTWQETNTYKYWTTTPVRPAILRIGCKCEIEKFKNSNPLF